MLKDFILKTKYSQVVRDPFPEISNWKHFKEMYPATGDHLKPPQEVNIWEAYQRGYDRAYNEILEAFMKLDK